MKDESYKVANLNELAAYLYTEKGKKYGETNFKKNIENFKQLPFKYIEGAIFFLWILERGLQGLSEVYSKNKWMWRMAKILIIFQSFGDTMSGFLNSRSDQSPYYPYLYVVPANVIQEFGFMTYEFNLIVSDIMKRDMDNMTDILSDTLQIMNDVISMFRLSVTEQLGNYNEYYYTDDPITMVPFIEEYDDLLCGYSATIRIKTKTYLDRCVAAFEPFPSDPCVSPTPTQTSTPTPTPTQP
jgi:hypothetical protein